MRVEVNREEDELLLSESVEEELDGREELPEGEEGPDRVLLSASLPVPQGILSPFGWAASVGGVLFPFSSVMVNLVVQYFSVEEEEVNS